MKPIWLWSKTPAPWPCRRFPSAGTRKASLNGRTFSIENGGNPAGGRPLGQYAAERGIPDKIHSGGGIAAAQFDQLGHAAPNSRSFFQQRGQFREFIGRHGRRCRPKASRRRQRRRRLVEREKRLAASGDDFHGGSQRFLPNDGGSAQPADGLIPGIDAHANLI